MQFDDFDKKIKEAAEHHHPAYEEKAWDQMEKLLDKHLPVEKDDRRRIVFLLLFLLLSVLGVYLGISKPWQQKKNITTNDVVTPVNGKNDAAPDNSSSNEETSEQPSGKTTLPGEKTAASSQKNSDKDKEGPLKVEIAEDKTSVAHKDGIVKQPIVLNSENQKIKRRRNAPGKDVVIAGRTVKHKNARNHKSTELFSVTPAPGNENSVDQQTTGIVSSVASNNPVKSDNTIDQSDKTTPITSDSSAKPKAGDVAKADNGIKKDNVVKEQSPKVKKKSKQAFALTFTAGPDISAVGLGEAGKVKLTYGAGLSYTLNRFTLRSGFYVAKKVYSAGPDDYHPPKHYWTYYVDLTKVDADCRVFEIPVTISYNLSETKNHIWFASAGLSSYLMKKETYGYYYKDAGQTPRYKDWTLENGENHIFSILNLSAGYERKLNKTLSIIAEPYLKVPFDGIGFGSIKLNSAGVLFTLSVKPFVTKK